LRKALGSAMHLNKSIGVEQQTDRSYQQSSNRAIIASISFHE
jgi:hypothetical protein